MARMTRFILLAWIWAAASGSTLAEHGMKGAGEPSPLPLSQGFQFPADRAAVLIFFKINVVQQGLYIKAGSAGNDRNTAVAENLPQGLLCHLLEGDHIKGVLGSSTSMR